MNIMFMPNVPHHQVIETHLEKISVRHKDTRN